MKSIEHEDTTASRPVLQAALLAALLAFACTLVMGYLTVRTQREFGLLLQPSHPSGPASEFIRPANEHPGLVLGFFAADSLLVLSYVIVFVGLHLSARSRALQLAWIGLGAGLVAAMLDAAENAFFITYALLAQNSAAIEEPALPLIYILANLKWMAAFAAFFAFGLIWDRDELFGWLISLLMLGFVFVGVLSIVIPGLVMLRGIILLLGFPLFAWHFFNQSGKDVALRKGSYG